MKAAASIAAAETPTPRPISSALSVASADVSGTMEAAEDGVVDAVVVGVLDSELVDLVVAAALNTVLKSGSVIDASASQQLAFWPQQYVPCSRSWVLHNVKT
jgi:hypothetical protein